MALNIFKKKDKFKKPPKNVDPVKVEEKADNINAEVNKTDKHSERIISVPGAYRVVKGFYISEKANYLSAFNQYVFKVQDRANKNEVREKIEKLFNVKVKDVKILNMPSKLRNVGRHSGIKPGYKKAIVILEKGYVIEQAKA